MPKVEKRTARKDYPESGIKKGDVYFYTKLKLQRGGIVKRSLKPFKPSQLTTSSFKIGWLSAEEAWGESGKTHEDIRAAAEALRDVASEAQDAFDNMPEGLQQGETGQMLENRATEGESVADELEGIDEPDDQPDDLDPDDFDTSDEYDEAVSDLDGRWNEFNDEVERIQNEADDLIGNIPE